MSAKAAAIGRPFLHPVVDGLLVGGGLSLLVTALVVARDPRTPLVTPAVLALLILFSNSAHFAASTVRLYTKPGMRTERPFVYHGLPLLMLALVLVAVWQAPRVGSHLTSLYFTWSPFHYAAQAYGIAVMYSFRSGFALTPGLKRSLFWVAMLPFLHQALTARGIGLEWLLPTNLHAILVRHGVVTGAHRALLVAGVTGPILWYWLGYRKLQRLPPLLALLPVVSNGVWFFVLDPLQAFAYATVFHGIQYLAMVMIFHIRDHLPADASRARTIRSAVQFYSLSLGLGYLLFHCLPQGFVALGFGMVESVLMAAAFINLHHFVVDAYIWRLRPGDRNRSVIGLDPAASPAP